jgi:phosphate transport system substrate-binding protein
LENQKKLRSVPVAEKEGKAPVAVSVETVKNGSYQPLSRPIFIYVSDKAYDRPEVKEFIQFYLKQAPKLVAEVKYVPLPDAAYKLASDNFAKRKLGTGFGGEAEVGVSVEDLLKREGKH